MVLFKVLYYVLSFIFLSPIIQLKFKNDELESIPTITEENDHFVLFPEDVRCWSLAALLSVLPDYTLQTNTDGTVFVVCNSKKSMVSDTYDNPVDAYVAMIEKLHKLKIL